jgi:hypothetical protein
MLKESQLPRQPKPWSPYLLLCDCGSSEHQMLFHLDPDNAAIYCHIHLAKRPLLKRVLFGLKYIFGYHCRYGHWDEFIFNPEDAPKLKSISSFLSSMKDVKKMQEEFKAAIDGCEKITLK